MCCARTWSIRASARQNSWTPGVRTKMVKKMTTERRKNRSRLYRRGLCSRSGSQKRLPRECHGGESCDDYSRTHFTGWHKGTHTQAGGKLPPRHHLASSLDGNLWHQQNDAFQSNTQGRVTNTNLERVSMCWCAHSFSWSGTRVTVWRNSLAGADRTVMATVSLPKGRADAGRITLLLDGTKQHD